MDNREFILREIERIPDKYNPIWRGEDVWCFCPFHGASELHLASKPSLKINMSDPAVATGAFYCWSCANKEDPNSGFGNWNKLAKKLKLRQLSKSNMYEQHITEDSDAEMALGLEENKFLKEEDLLIQSIPWKDKEDWRSINGQVLHDLGARKIVTRYGEIQLYLPVYMDKVMIGGVNCRLTKQEGQISYINEKGSWAKRCFFPLDYVINTFGTDYVFLVEGPRDALHLIQNGIPALALLGSATKWGQYHAEELLKRRFKLIGIAFDADDAGRRASRMAIKDLKEAVPILRLKMKNESDPAQLGIKALSVIRRAMVKKVKAIKIEKRLRKRKLLKRRK